MKLAIVGGRDFNDWKLFRAVITDVIEKPWETTVISGGARGADSMAKDIANNWGLGYIEFSADWDKYGKSAGFIRNRQIVDYCDKLVAFWDGKSKGTKHSIDLAKEQGKLFKIISY